jgi:amino acid transporter
MPQTTKYVRDSLELASLVSSENSIHSPSGSSSPAGISSSRRLSLADEDPLDKSGRPDNRGRTYSVSSTFDYAANLFPLSSTTGYAPIGAPADQAVSGSLEKRKTLTYLNGLSLIVSLVIGSGIFASPGQISSNVSSIGASLVVWIIAGLLVWTGASSYVELGSAIPLNGGAQAYLSRIFGELAGFLFSWAAICVLKPSSSAIIAIILGEYVFRAVYGGDADENQWVIKGVSLVALTVVTGLNLASTRLAARVGDTFMFIKFIVLLSIAIIGLVAAVTGFSNDGKPNKEFKEKGWFDGTSHAPEQWAIALYSALWAFDGWENVNYVTGELRNPRRDLPRVTHTAIPMIIVAYLVTNIAYFLVLPIEVIGASNTVALLFAEKLFGAIGSIFIALAVSVSCFGALNASIFTSGRLIAASSRDGYLPALFGRIGFSATAPETPHLRSETWVTKQWNKIVGDDGRLGLTPVYAILLNSVLTAAYILVGEFGALLTFYGAAGYSFYFLTVLGVIVLRVKEPNLERPYKAFITTPVIFCCVSLFLVFRAVVNTPLQSLFVLAFVASGVPVYYVRMKMLHGK